MHENELVEALRKGDERAYRFLVDTYQSLVLNCCYRFVEQSETAEDLTQEVFIEVYRSIRSFRSESKLSTWIFRIAITKSLDHAKGLKRKKRFTFLKSLVPGDENEVLSVASDEASPHQLLENEERKNTLLRVLRSLPENQRVAFTLSKYDELSYKEIAEILNTTVPSVESLIFRAKANLKIMLHRYYEQQL
jgi:RNA polymerase sigma factor (sigma-70 family)